MEEVKKILSSWITTAVLLIFMSVALAVATFIEAKLGTQAARSVIYEAWWMYLLYAALIINFITISTRTKLIRNKKWGALTLHYGFVVTIAGALITHIWSYEGMMHIREGQSSDKIILKDGSTHTVPMNLFLNKFTVERYHGSNSPSSFESDVTIEHNDQTFRQKIFMNNIARVAGYRIYQSSYDKDEKGTILTVNFDPVGTAVTYIGYFLLVAGMTIALCGPESRLRVLYKTLEKEN